MTSDAIIDLKILELLHGAGEILTHHSTVIQHVRLVVSPKPMTSEVTSRIRSLDSRGFILSQSSAYGMKYKITDEGRAHWREYGE